MIVRSGGDRLISRLEVNRGTPGSTARRLTPAAAQRLFVSAWSVFPISEGVYAALLVVPGGTHARGRVAPGAGPARQDLLAVHLHGRPGPAVPRPPRRVGLGLG